MVNPNGIAAPATPGVTYQNPTPQYYPPCQTGFIADWVNGYAGAQAYRLLPNAKAILLDSDDNGEGKMYIKTADSIGMCQIRTFEFHETTNANQQPAAAVPSLEGYVTKDELSKTIDELKGFIEDLKSQNRPKHDNSNRSFNKQKRREDYRYEDEQ